MVEYQKLIPDAPERILRMAEASSVDESRRLDRVTEIEAEQVKADRSAASAFFFFCFVAAVVFFALGNNIAGTVLLGPPVAQMIKTLVTSKKRN